MGIFGDQLRQSFGFPTKKESFDHRIERYGLHEHQSLEYSIASRNIAISYINEQIRQLERIINDNQVFIDAFETIKAKAAEKIKEGANPETISLVDSKGNVIAKGNYASLESYKTSLIKRGLNSKLLSTYVNMLGLAYEKLWQNYAEQIIKGQGLYIKNGQDIDECYDIYTTYIQSLNLMNAQSLRDANRVPVAIYKQNMPFILEAYQLAMNNNSILRLALQELQISLDKLNSEQASDEYAKKIIEEIQAMMHSTKEYFYAKKSHEALEEIKGLRK